jgi:hypothetical protein
MPFVTRPLAIAAAAVSLGAALCGCGGSSTPSVPVSGRLVGASSTSPGQIVLSALGAQRIGLQTARATAVRAPATVTKTTTVAGVKHTTTIHPAAPPGSPTVIVPYSALIYDPSGQVYVFSNTATLTYVEVPITVDRVSGNDAYLVKGPKPGTAVVSVGAEELYGVQTGVLAQT